jgi:hypothetical protein
MQCTADFHHAIANTRLPEAAGVVDDAAALDTTVDVLNADAAAIDAPAVGRLVPESQAQASAPVAGVAGRYDALQTAASVHPAALACTPGTDACCSSSSQHPADGPFPA